MNKISPKWVDGFSVPLKSKFACILLSLFAIFPGAFVSYKIESFTGVGISLLIFLLLWGFAFYRTWLFVDEKNKLILIRKRFFLTWVSSASYMAKRLYVGGSPVNSPSFQQYNAVGTHDIYLLDRATGKKKIIFSSSIGRDYLRVLRYLSPYFESSNQ